MIHKFKKWLSGEITWKEEKELRKEAANDSALADAIEGYEQFPKSDHLQKIHQLNKRVRQQTSSQESRNKFPLRAIAASFIVLVAVGLFWMVNQNLIPTVSDSTAYQIPAETRVSKEAIETSPTQTQSKQRTPIASLPTPAVPTAENKSFNNDVGTTTNTPATSSPPVAKQRKVEPVSPPPAKQSVSLEQTNTNTISEDAIATTATPTAAIEDIPPPVSDAPLPKAEGIVQIFDEDPVEESQIEEIQEEYTDQQTASNLSLIHI